MNKEILAGNWKQLRGEIRARWGDLTDDELDRARGNLEILAGVIEERYGLAKEEARKQLEKLSKPMTSRKSRRDEPAMKAPSMKEPELQDEMEPDLEESLRR